MKKMTIAATLACVLSAPLMAQDGEPRGPREGAKDAFQQLDLNANGVVTHNELMQEARKHFAEFDLDGNGTILLSELPDKMPLPPRAERRLAKMQDKAQSRDQSGQRSETRRGPRMSPEDRAEKMRPTRLKFMAKMDKNGDEQLNLEEFSAPIIKRFKRADVNGDGDVTTAELEQSMEQRRHKHRRNMKSDRR